MPYLWTYRTIPVDPPFPTCLPEGEVGGDVDDSLAVVTGDDGMTQEGPAWILGGDDMGDGAAPRPLAQLPGGRLHRRLVTDQDPLIVGRFSVPPSPLHLETRAKHRQPFVFSLCFSLVFLYNTLRKCLGRTVIYICIECRI